MHRIVCVALAVVLLASAAYGAAFTSGNFLIVYADTPTTSTDSKTISPTFIEEFQKTGTSVQSIDISTACSTDANPYTGAPKVSTDGTYVTIACRIPSGAETNNGNLRAVIAAVNSAGSIDTTTQWTRVDTFYRAQLDGDHLYVAGRSLIGYTPFQSADSMVNLVSLSGAQHVQDAYTYKGQLYITNWSGNSWGLATVGSSLPVTTAGQSASTVWATSFIQFPDTINFFDVGDEEYMYISEETGYEIRKLKKVSGTWTLLYATSTGFSSSSTIITSQIYYDNGDGTTTILFATDKKIYRTIDNGSSFSGITEIVARTTKVIKGISWVPTGGVAPVAAPEATPVADPPVFTPIADPPVDAPLADPPVSTPVNESPIAEPMVEVPMANEPVATTPISDVPVSAPTSSNAPTSSKTPSGKVSSANAQSVAVVVAIGAVMAAL